MGIESFVVVNRKTKNKDIRPYVIMPNQYERYDFPFGKPIRVSHSIATRAMQRWGRSLSLYTSKDWISSHKDQCDIFVGRSQGLGDLLMLTPSLRALHAEGWRITMAVGAQFAPLVREWDFVHEVVECKPNQMPATKMTNKIDLNLKVERVRGHNLRVPRSKLFGKLLGLDLPEDDKAVSLSIPEYAKDTAKTLMGDKEWVVIPSKTSTTFRDYPHTEDLVNRLAEKGYHVAVIHHSQVFEFRHPYILDLQKKLDILEMCAVIKRAAVVVTPDTGPMHVAMAVKTPCIALEGPMPAKVYHWNYPDSPKHVMTKDLPCLGCGHKGKQARYGCKGKDNGCMDFAPDEIIKRIDKLLGRSIRSEVVEPREQVTSDLWADDEVEV